jgi:hypothetical protein
MRESPARATTNGMLTPAPLDHPTGGAFVTTPGCACRRFAVALLATAALLAAGCTTRLAYNSADFLVSRYVDSYVSFDAEQQAEFDRRLETLIAWHRADELPAYAAWLEGVSAAVGSQSGVTAQQVTAWREDLSAFWRRAAERLAPELVAIGGSLNDEQVDDLLAKLAEDQAKLVGRYGDRTPEERFERRVRSMERFLARWTGRLTRPQKALVEAWARELKPTTELWLASRAGWAAELNSALVARGDRARLEAAVERLFVDPSVRWSQAYRVRIEENTAATARLLAELINALEPRQRAKARSRISDLAQDLTGLAADT